LNPNRILLASSFALVFAGVVVLAFSQRPWLPRSDVVQPMPFSHRVHAGLNQIPCQFCHEYARRSDVAGAPPVQRCVACHGAAMFGGIAPVTRPWTDDAQPPFEIRWNRVYTLPDFVRFSHRVHVAAGIECQSCHGPVETMERIVPVFEVNMGFCVDCHSQRGATVDCVVCHH
jgi:hypothetical protein